jgi:hypothetical protein
MRQILIISAAFFTLNAFGQIKNIKVPEVKNLSSQAILQNDTSLKVTYVNKNVSDKSPAYYLNGQLADESILNTLNPNSIKDIRIEEQELVEGTKKFYGQIFIATKDNYELKLISLTDLKIKYTELKKGSTFFMIDNEIINDDYDKYLVDENYIFRIFVEKIENKKERLKFNLVRIMTKTEENIRKSKEIRIRGTEGS